MAEVEVTQADYELFMSICGYDPIGETAHRIKTGSAFSWEVEQIARHRIASVRAAAMSDLIAGDADLYDAPSDDLVERMAELQLAAFLAGRGSVTNMMHGTRTCKPAPSMDDFRRMVIAALAGEQ